MTSLDNLLIIGVRDETDDGMTDLETGMTHFSLNIWMAKQPSGPAVIPVPYRGGYTGGFNNLTVVDRHLIVADGEGLLAYDLTAPSKGYAEFNGVQEVSEAICLTPNYIVSAMSNRIQSRSLQDMTHALEQSHFKKQQLDIPFREFDHGGEGSTPLSLMRVGDGENEAVLLNDAKNNTYLINPHQSRAQPVKISTDQEFSHAFQRQQQYHFISEEPSRYTIFTESTFRESFGKSTSDDQHPDRIYSLDIRGPPIITELEPLVLENRQVLSMVPTLYNQLTLLTNHNGRNYIETLEPNRRKILNSRPLNRRYELGDRLQQVDNDLLIARHLKNEIVDAATEGSIHLTGAENDIPIPEISSTWRVPQYLFVASNPVKVGNGEKEKRKGKKKKKKNEDLDLVILRF